MKTMIKEHYEKYKRLIKFELMQHLPEGDKFDDSDLTKYWWKLKEDMSNLHIITDEEFYDKHSYYIEDLLGVFDYGMEAAKEIIYMAHNEIIREYAPLNKIQFLHKIKEEWPLYRK